MADDQKRRELIFQMAMDMNRKNAGEPHVSGHASMSQGHPPEDGDPESLVQADDLLTLARMAATAAKVPAVSAVAGMAGMAGKMLEKKALRKAAAKAMEEGAEKTLKSEAPEFTELMAKDAAGAMVPGTKVGSRASTEDAWTRLMDNLDAPPRPPRGNQETIWANEDFAKKMGTPKGMADDDFFSGQGTRVDPPWGSRANPAFANREDDLVKQYSDELAGEQAKHETIWMQDAFAKAMGKKSPIPTDEFVKGAKTQVSGPPEAAVRELEPTNSMKRVPPKPPKPDTVVPSGGRALRDKELQSRVDSMVEEMHSGGTKLRVDDVEKFADELEDKALSLMESKNERLVDEAEKMIATSELLRKTAWDLLE